MNGMMTPMHPIKEESDDMESSQNSAPGVVGDDQEELDEGVGVVQTMQLRLKAFAKENPQVLEQVQSMLTPEVGFVIGILFGTEPLKILDPMINREMTSKAVPKAALERIGLDKFESMMTKATEKSQGLMAPRKQASENKPAPKATQ